MSNPSEESTAKPGNDPLDPTVSQEPTKSKEDKGERSSDNVDMEVAKPTAVVNPSSSPSSGKKTQATSVPSKPTPAAVNIEDVKLETPRPGSVPVNIAGSEKPSPIPAKTRTPRPEISPDSEEVASTNEGASNSGMSFSESDSSPEPAFASSQVSPTPSRGAVPSTTSDDGSTCFPSHALAKLENGRQIRMDNLRIGDVVHVGDGIVSPIMAFSHADHHVVSQFLKFTTEVGKVIMITPTHFMYTSRGLLAGKEVSTADRLRLEDGTSTKVMKIERMMARGLFNPHTAQGDIVVDGFTTSTYTTAIVPGAAHALLTPVRVLEWFGTHSSIVLQLSSSPWWSKTARRIFDGF